MLADVFYQVITAFRVHIRISEPVSFHHDLLLEKRFQNNGTDTGFIEFLIFFSTIS